MAKLFRLKSQKSFYSRRNFRLFNTHKPQIRPVFIRFIKSRLRFDSLHSTVFRSNFLFGIAFNAIVFLSHGKTKRHTRHRFRCRMFTAHMCSCSFIAARMSVKSIGYGVKNRRLTGPGRSVNQEKSLITE